MTHSSLLPALSVNIETPSLAGSAGGYLVFDDATYGKFDTGKFAPLGGYQKDQVALTRQVNVKRGDSSPTDVMFHAQTGTASVVLDNRTRTFDPVSNTDVRPMRGINITATWGNVGPLLSADSFNRADGALGGSSTDGAGSSDPLTWSTGSFFGAGGTNTLTIVSHQVKQTAGKPAAVVDLGTADVLIQCSMSNTSTPPGLTARYTDTNNQFSLIGNSGNWSFNMYATGSLTVLGSTVSILTGDTPQILCNGSTVTAQIVRSGGSVVTVYSGTQTFNQTVTKHGLALYMTNALADDFAAYSANTTYDLFTGFVTDWNETYPASGKDAVTSAQCADGSYLLVNTDVAESLGTGLSGTRVNNLLDLAEWPQSLRAVEAGATQMPASIPTGSAWSAMQEAADSEMGDLYVAADGTMTFRARTSLVSDSRSTTSQATFGDGGGAELPFADVVFSYDTKRIHNTVSVSWNEQGDTVYQSDAVSLTAYGPQAFNVQASIADRATAQHLADFIVDLYKQPLIRIDSLVLKPARAPSTLWPQALGLEIGDRITVKLTPPGGGSRISRDGWVRGIEHQITADGDWTTSFTMQDVSNLDSYIVFDTSVFDGTDLFWF